MWSASFPSNCILSPLHTHKPYMCGLSVGKIQEFRTDLIPGPDDSVYAGSYIVAIAK